jgi:hypothetical protein
MSGGAALTAAELEQWLRDASPSLLDRRISAVLGRGARLTKPGATWISFSSTLGHGRLVREADGSSTATARRNHDGERILATTAPTTTADQLDTLVAALAG